MEAGRGSVVVGEGELAKNVKALIRLIERIFEHGRFERFVLCVSVGADRVLAHARGAGSVAEASQGIVYGE